MRKRGLFITFEGGEGSGKSTQIKETAKYLRKKGFRVEVYREPGSTAVGEAVREVLLDTKLNKMVWQTELLLFLAARAQLVREKIMPALKQGKAVLVDRFEDSTVAYQGYGRGLKMEKIESFFSFVRESCVPNLTLFLDVPVSTGLKRAAQRGKKDRMEKSKMDFHERVRKGFLSLAKKHPARIQIVRSDRPVAEVREDIYVLLNRLLG